MYGLGPTNIFKNNFVHFKSNFRFETLSISLVSFPANFPVYRRHIIYVDVKVTVVAVKWTPFVRLVLWCHKQPSHRTNLAATATACVGRRRAAARAVRLGALTVNSPYFLPSPATRRVNGKTERSCCCRRCVLYLRDY